MTLIPVTVYATVCLLIFWVFRRKFPRVYAPRTILSSLEPQCVQLPLHRVQQLMKPVNVVIHCPRDGSIGYLRSTASRTPTFWTKFRSMATSFSDISNCYASYVGWDVFLRGRSCFRCIDMAGMGASNWMNLLSGISRTRCGTMCTHVKPGFFSVGL